MMLPQTQVIVEIRHCFYRVLNFYLLDINKYLHVGLLIIESGMSRIYLVEMKALDKVT